MISPTRAAIATIATVLAAGCGQAAAARPSASPSTKAVRTGSAGCGHSGHILPGHDGTVTIDIDPNLAEGVAQRTATVYIPAGYRDTTPAPLVMEFHGASPTASGAGYEASSPLHALADRHGFIDVFPQGLRYPNGNLGWNAYGPVIVKVAEIPFVDDLLDAIAQTECVDESRVYASGVSNGGNMVNYVACRDAARFAAVAPVVGPMYGQDDGPCRPSRPVPIIDLHSLNDPAFPYTGLPGPPANDFPLPSVPDWLAGWAGLDGCPARPSQVVVTAAQQRRTWSPCRDGAQIVAYATEAGHAWPAQLDGRSAAEVVWAFLSRFHL